MLPCFICNVASTGEIFDRRIARTRNSSLNNSLQKDMIAVSRRQKFFISGIKFASPLLELPFGFIGLEKINGDSLEI